MSAYSLRELHDRGKTLDIFVYGSLRTGQILHPWLEDHITRKSSGTTKGWIHPYGPGTYPVAFFSNKTGVKDKIIGEVFTVPLVEEVLACIEMETSAGYVIHWVEVEFENGNKIRALSFEYGIADDPDIGDVIPSGDWVDYLAERADDLQELIAQTLGTMIYNDQELFYDIVNEILEESNDPTFTEKDALNDLEFMLFKPEFNEEIKLYVKHVKENDKDV